MSARYLLSVLRNTYPYYHTKVVSDIITCLEAGLYDEARQIMLDRADEIEGTLFKILIEKYLRGAYYGK